MTREEFDALLSAVKTMLSAPFKTFDIAGYGIKTGICIDESVYKTVEPLLSSGAKYEYKIGSITLRAENKLIGKSIAIKGSRRIILLPDEYARYTFYVEIVRVMEGLAKTYDGFSRQEIYRET